MINVMKPTIRITSRLVVQLIFHKLLKSNRLISLFQGTFIRHQKYRTNRRTRCQQFPSPPSVGSVTLHLTFGKKLHLSVSHFFRPFAPKGKKSTRFWGRWIVGPKIDLKINFASLNHSLFLYSTFHRAAS